MINFLCYGYGITNTNRSHFIKSRLLRNADNLISGIDFAVMTISSVGLRFIFWYRSQSHSVPPITMTTMTKQALPKGLTARIRKLSKGDHDLVEQDRQSREQSCFHSHCKRVWQQLTSKERDVIRDAVKKEITFFDRYESTDFLLEPFCIKRVEEMVRESGSYSFAK